MTILEWQAELNRNAKEKGFWDTERNIGEQIALMHSELSEALEEMRDPDKRLNQIYYNPMKALQGKDGKYFNKPEGFGIELADCVIRILETAFAYGIDMEECMRLKHEYNKLRPRMHGKVC